MWLLPPALGVFGFLVFSSSRQDVPDRIPQAVPPSSARPLLSERHSNDSQSPAVVKNAIFPASTFPAMPNEWLVKFQAAEEMEAFLARVRKIGGRVLAVIPRLGVVRIGFDTDEQGIIISDLVPSTADTDYNYLVSAPSPPNPQNDPGGPYLGFGTEALTWLGVPADNTQWGQGIRIAILDTGLTEVPGLSLGGIRQLDLTGSAAGNPESLLHGTAVASILGGTAAEARGMVPAAELLSFRVLDDTGTGNSFTTAQAILSAVDAGARVISMSLGTSADNQVLRDAINYAISQNVAVVAAVGNDGVGSVYYPANYPGVIAVTAVDANGQRGSFANHGPGVTIAAPGMGVVTPWVNQQGFSFSGTSAAVPFVSGAIAMLFSENPNLTSTQAAQVLVGYSDDAGASGKDSYFGAGILNMNRVLSRNEPGRHDIAIADYYFNPQDLNSAQGRVPVQVTIQNRGTTALSSVSLDIVNNGQSQRTYFNAMPAGSVRSQTISVPASALRSQNGAALQSQVQTIGISDINPANNSRSVTLRSKETRP